MEKPGDRLANQVRESTRRHALEHKSNMFCCVSARKYRQRHDCPVLLQQGRRRTQFCSIKCCEHWLAVRVISWWQNGIAASAAGKYGKPAMSHACSLRGENDSREQCTAQPAPPQNSKGSSRFSGRNILPIQCAPTSWKAVSCATRNVSA